MDNILDYYNNKKIFVTGHTGFKGAWLCESLILAGANVFGYSLEPEEQSLYNILRLEREVNSTYADVRDVEGLQQAIKDSKADIVIHMAAQPLVIEGYNNPVYTYETNVMGTVNVLEAIRISGSVRSLINVTTDKVYRNIETERPYIESDELCGEDPYANSKSCSELITQAYMKSFFKHQEIVASTCRAGNVIGGGDFAPNRIIPDCYRAVLANEKILVRNPCSVRPYQFVLEPIAFYLMLAAKQYNDYSYAGEYNIGPNKVDNITTGDLVDIFCKYWTTGVEWYSPRKDGAVVHEAKLLYLDCEKARTGLNWRPKYDVDSAVRETVEWYYEYMDNPHNIKAFTDKQIRCFFGEDKVL